MVSTALARRPFGQLIEPGNVILSPRAVLSCPVLFFFFSLSCFDSLIALSRFTVSLAADWRQGASVGGDTASGMR